MKLIMNQACWRGHAKGVFENSPCSFGLPTGAVSAVALTAQRLARLGTFTAADNLLSHETFGTCDLHSLGIMRFLECPLLFGEVQRAGFWQLAALLFRRES